VSERHLQRWARASGAIAGALAIAALVVAGKPPAADATGAELAEAWANNDRLLADAGFPPLAPEQPLQMAAFRLPECDPKAVQRRLFEEFRIEVPVRAWNGRHLVRVSVAPYTEVWELERLADALAQVLESSLSTAARARPRAAGRTAPRRGRGGRSGGADARRGPRSG